MHSSDGVWSGWHGPTATSFTPPGALGHGNGSPVGCFRKTSNWPLGGGPGGGPGDGGPGGGGVRGSSLGQVGAFPGYYDKGSVDAYYHSVYRLQASPASVSFPGESNVVVVVAGAGSVPQAVRCVPSLDFPGSARMVPPLNHNNKVASPAGSGSGSGQFVNRRNQNDNESKPCFFRDDNNNEEEKLQMKEPMMDDDEIAPPEGWLGSPIFLEEEGEGDDSEEMIGRFLAEDHLGIL